MAQVFAVTRTHGASWNDTLSLEGQHGWADHAFFMNGLEIEGFVILGGPLKGTPQTLLIVRATSADDIRSRLAQDPWERDGTLRTLRVDPWNIRLGSLPAKR